MGKVINIFEYLSDKEDKMATVDIRAVEDYVTDPEDWTKDYSRGHLELVHSELDVDQVITFNWDESKSDKDGMMTSPYDDPYGFLVSILEELGHDVVLTIEYEENE